MAEVGIVDTAYPCYIIYSTNDIALRTSCTESDTEGGDCNGLGCHGDAN